MELTKIDTQKAQGAAALGMVMLHLFCRLEDLPYTPLMLAICMAVSAVVNCVHVPLSGYWSRAYHRITGAR